MAQSRYLRYVGYLRAFIEGLNTSHHTAMKPKEKGGVVDARLNVYGTQNLKCVDLSICPVR